MKKTKEMKGITLVALVITMDIKVFSAIGMETKKNKQH